MPGFTDRDPVRPIAGFSPGARAHGLTSPVLAQVDEGDLVGRWFIEGACLISNRGIGANPTMFSNRTGLNFNQLSGVAPIDMGDGSKGPIFGFRSNALLAGVAGYQTSVTDIMDPARLPVYTCFIKTGPVLANIRLWAGLSGFGGITQNDDDPGFAIGASSNYCGFRYSDGVDAGFVGVTRNAVLATFSVTPMIKAIAVNTEYQLRVRILSSTQVGFQINGEQEVFTASSIPDFTNATNKWLAPTISHINKTAASHDTGYMGDLTYLAG